MHIVRTEQSMRRWIVCGSLGVLLCSTGWQPLCVILLTVFSCLATVRPYPQICSNASCFALGTDLRGIRSIVFLLAMALLALSSPPGAEIETQPRLPEKCNPRLGWKTALMIALLREEKRILGSALSQVRPRSPLFAKLIIACLFVWAFFFLFFSTTRFFNPPRAFTAHLFIFMYD